jgi:hypothetical protein
MGYFLGCGIIIDWHFTTKIFQASEIADTFGRFVR